MAKWYIFSSDNNLAAIADNDTYKDKVVTNNVGFFAKEETTDANFTAVLKELKIPTYDGSSVTLIDSKTGYDLDTNHAKHFEAWKKSKIDNIQQYLNSNTDSDWSNILSELKNFEVTSSDYTNDVLPESSWWAKFLAIDGVAQKSTLQLL